MTAKRWISGLIGIGMLACFAAGCDDGEGDALTPEEAAALAKLIGRASVGPLVGQSLGSLPPNGPAHMAAKEYDFDVPCSEGGSANLSGTADFDFGEDGKSFQTEGTITFDHCAEKTDDDVTFTLTGSIDMLLHGLVSFSDGVARIELDGSWNGSVAWENEDDGSSGVCEVDVTLDATIEIDLETKSYDAEGGLTGTVCGISVEGDADDWLKMGKGGF